MSWATAAAPLPAARAASRDPAADRVARLQALQGDEAPRHRREELGGPRQLPVVGRIDGREHHRDVRVGRVHLARERVPGGLHRRRRGRHHARCAGDRAGAGRPLQHRELVAALVGGEGEIGHQPGRGRAVGRRLGQGPLQPAPRGLVPAEQPLHRRTRQRQARAAVAGRPARGLGVHDLQRLAQPPGLDERAREGGQVAALGVGIGPLGRQHPVGGGARRLRPHLDGGGAQGRGGGPVPGGRRVGQVAGDDRRRRSGGRERDRRPPVPLQAAPGRDRGVDRAAEDRVTEREVAGRRRGAHDRPLGEPVQGGEARGGLEVRDGDGDVQVEGIARDRGRLDERQGVAGQPVDLGAHRRHDAVRHLAVAGRPDQLLQQQRVAPRLPVEIGAPPGVGDAGHQGVGRGGRERPPGRAPPPRPIRSRGGRPRSGRRRPPAAGPAPRAAPPAAGGGRGAPAAPGWPDRPSGRRPAAAPWAGPGRSRRAGRRSPGAGASARRRAPGRRPPMVGPSSGKTAASRARRSSPRAASAVGGRSARWGSMASITGTSGTSFSSSVARPSRITKRRARALARSSASSRVLPMPASPRSTSVRRSPPATASRTPATAASSSSRPWRGIPDTGRG